MDQNSEDSIFHLLTAFDLTSTEDLEEKVVKLEHLFDIYGVDLTHVMPEWFNFQVRATYEKRLTCTKEMLVKQFEDAHEKIVSMSRDLRDDRRNHSEKKLSQHKLWMQFLNNNGMQFPDLCDLVLIMISVPPNSGYVERAYSYLEQVCQKKRNRIDISNLRELFFLAVLKLPVKDSYSYSKEIDILSGLV